MELESYLINPESAKDHYLLHTIRANLTAAALALDSRSRSFHVGRAHKKGCLHPASQTESSPLRVDLLDAKRHSLLDMYHDLDPKRYDSIVKKLRGFLTDYLDRGEFLISVLGSDEEVVTDSGTLPRHWLQKILPRLHGIEIAIGGPSTLYAAMEGSDRADGETRIAIGARSRPGSRTTWDLVCDIEGTVKDVRYDLDVYPEFLDYGATISAIREKLAILLEDLYNRGSVVSPVLPPPAGWGFSETDYAGVYVLGWEDSRLTLPSGGATAFAERLCAIDADIMEETGPMIPYRCPDNNQCRHFVSRMMLELGYGAPTFQKDRMLQTTQNYKEASAISSLTETFAVSFAGSVGGERIIVKTIKRVRPTPPDKFRDARPDQKSIYLDLDGEEIYVYSVMQEYRDGDPLRSIA